MKKLNTTLLLAALILVLSVVLINKLDCHRRPASVTPVLNTVKVIDSTAVAREKRFRDSTDKLLKQITRKNDSLRIANAQLSNQLNYTLKRAAAIATDLQLAKQDKDTARYTASADSLPAIITQLQIESDKREKGFEYEREGYLSEIHELRGQLVERDTLIAQQEKSKKLLMDAVQKQAKDIEKLVRKDGRKYVLGPSINYGVSPTGQIVVSIGISLQRTILKIKL